MTDELRIAVCEAMGWRHCYDDGQLRAVWVSPISGYAYCESDLPPLTQDLMWIAEEMLGEDECRRYNDLLADIAVKPNILTFPIVAKAYLFHATSEQRAEAFLKVKGK